jgi:hypothetical protein
VDQVVSDRQAPEWRPKDPSMILEATPKKKEAVEALAVANAHFLILVCSEFLEIYFYTELFSESPMMDFFVLSNDSFWHVFDCFALLGSS